jgi:peptidoglycan hydrolase CwlO-like protein
MGGDFVDFTLLARKGLLKTESPASSPEMVDFTQSSAPSSSVLPSTTSATSSLDFLGDLAQTGASSSVSALSSFQQSASLEPKIDTVLSKVEDVMYKLETLTSRIVQLESRIEQLTGFRG